MSETRGGRGGTREGGNKGGREGVREGYEGGSEGVREGVREGGREGRTREEAARGKRGEKFDRVYLAPRGDTDKENRLRSR